MKSESTKDVTNLRSWSMMILLVILFCVISGVLVEWSLRNIGPSSASVFIENEYSISQYKPSINRIRYPRDTPVPFRTNRFGIRDDSQLNPAEADILVLGDSNIAAMYLPFSDTIGEHMEKLLGQKITVANLGVPGYGPDQSLQRFTQYSSAAKPRAVVFHFFADNDFGDLFRNNIFRSDGDDDWLVRESLDQEPMIVWQRYKLLQRVWSILGLTRQDFDQWVAGKNYYNSRWSNFDHSISEYERYKQGQFTSWLGDHYDDKIANAPSGIEAQEAKRILSFILSKLATLFNQDRECLVFLIQPSEKDLYRELETENTQDGGDYYPRALVDLAVSAANESKINYINLFPYFLTSPQKYYFTEQEYPGDNHWTEKGISKAAELTVQHLVDNSCI